VSQKKPGEGELSVPVIIWTHSVQESALRKALEEIDQLPDVTSPTRLIRVEEEM
jgi:hypothetical protein